MEIDYSSFDERIFFDKFNNICCKECSTKSYNLDV